MKISFWGTAAGLAEKNRYCTSICIEVDNEYYILDFGAPVEYLIAQHNICVEQIKAGFVSHMHSDHAEALAAFAKLYAQFTDFLYADARTELYMPEGIDELNDWLNALHLDMSDRMVIRKISAGVIYQNDKLRVEAIRTEHMGKDIPSYAFVFSAGGKRILFTGDLCSDLHDLPCDCSYDLVVCEIAHGNVMDIIRCINQSLGKKVVFYHMSTDRALLEKLGRDRLTELKNAKSDLNKPFEVAYDGYEIEL